MTTASIDAITCDADTLGTLLFDTDENKVKVCKSDGWNLLSPDCDASTETVGGHTYNVPAIEDGLSDVVTSVAYSISNGQATSTQTFVCNRTIISTSGGETPTITSCNTNYYNNGSACVSSSCGLPW